MTPLPLMLDPFKMLWHLSPRTDRPAAFVALYVLAFLLLTTVITAPFDILGHR